MSMRLRRELGGLILDIAPRNVINRSWIALVTFISLRTRVTFIALVALFALLALITLRTLEVGVVIRRVTFLTHTKFRSRPVVLSRLPSIALRPLRAFRAFRPRDSCRRASIALRPRVPLVTLRSLRTRVTFIAF